MRNNVNLMKRSKGARLNQENRGGISFESFKTALQDSDFIYYFHRKFTKDDLNLLWDYVSLFRVHKNSRSLSNIEALAFESDSKFKSLNDINIFIDKIDK